MSRYSEFFLKSKSSVAQLETLEISHSAFSKTYRVVRNALAGVTVTLETGEHVDFDYYPLRISGVGVRADLDYGLRVDLGDLGEVLPLEFDRVASNNGFSEKPVVKYRTYSSDYLLEPMDGPIRLEVRTFNFNREGSTFIAAAPALNNNVTGELYKLDRFPMLRGFL